MAKILINGGFYCRRLTGIERYAVEITKRLDDISNPGEIAIILPANAETAPAFRNFDVIRLKKNITSHLRWQMITLQWFLLTHREYTILDYGNTCLPLAPGIVFLHDIYQELYPGDISVVRDKIVNLYFRYQYRLIAKKAKQVITVSEFTRNQFCGHFKYTGRPIKVIYSSWEHFKNITADNSVFNDFPALKPKAFYFLLGSLSKRKNLKWIVDYAVKHPQSLFAISGVSLPIVGDKDIKNINYKNILMLGYLNDQKIRALMEQCRAFILPSYYEGFGLTPLEALSCGAEVIVSSAASLPEIYGNCAHYIDPGNTDVDLERLLQENVEPPDEILKKYSYDKAALDVYSVIKDFV